MAEIVPQATNIVSHAICMEAANVFPVTIDDWKRRIPSIVDGYKFNGIYNCAETELFYSALPDKALAIKGQECRGGKRSKEDVTALLNLCQTLKMLLNYSFTPIYISR